jgi:hypothetical protein
VVKNFASKFPPFIWYNQHVGLCSCCWPSWNIKLHICTVKCQQFLQAFNQYNALLYLVRNFICVRDADFMLRYITGWTRQQYTVTQFRIMTIHLHGTKTNISSTTLRVVHFPWCIQAESLKLQVRPPFHLHQSWFINYSNLYHSPFHNTNRWFTKQSCKWSSNQ